MQHIVVRTAKPANLKAMDWVTNGVGRNGELDEISFTYYYLYVYSSLLYLYNVEFAYGIYIIVQNFGN